MIKEFIKDNIKYTFEKSFIHFSGKKMFIYNRNYIPNNNKLDNTILTTEQLNFILGR